MYQIELSYCKKAINKLLITLLLIIILDIILLIILFAGDIIMNDILKDIIIGIISGVIPSIAVTIFIYFKFLKTIPEETEKRINVLLNERLSYETTQHEGTMKALNPDNSQLSLDHRDINKNLSRLNEKITSYETEKKAQYSILDMQGKNIVNSIETLNAFSTLYQETNEKVTQLKALNLHLEEELVKSKKEIQKLEEKNLKLRIENKELSQNRDVRREDFLDL